MRPIKMNAAGTRDLHPGEARAWDLAQLLAIKAWAEALNSGDIAEVEYLLAKAFTFCRETVVPVRAQVYYHAGCAYSALGKIEESASHFQRAARLDPYGNYGRLGKARIP
jgi:tetratricopeptide (TPR) repeat protein